jgi:flagellar motor switch protein FliM
MPTLERINERFCQYLRSALLRYLPAQVEVTPPIAIQLLNQGELTAKLEDPSHLTLAELRPLRGAVLVIVEAQLVRWIVESRFGGNGRFPPTAVSREFTPFEHKTMRRVVTMTLDQFALAWKPIAALAPEILRHETSPQFAEIAAAAGLIIVNNFDLKVADGAGKLTICLPYAMLEPLHEQLVTGAARPTAGHDLQWRESLTAGVGRAMMLLRVELAKIEMPVGELLRLQPGSVFEIERPARVIIEANGFPLFRADWGRLGHRIGVRIEESLVVPAGVFSAMPMRGRGGFGDDGR